MKHLPGCRTYQNEREAAGITRETTLHFLLFTLKGNHDASEIYEIHKDNPRGWLLQGGGVKVIEIKIYLRGTGMRF